jgi:sulfatase modifying factor 1
LTDALLSPSNRIRHPLVDGSAPEWASGWGQDEYGIFAEFSLPTGDNDWVPQRMRWIPPGSFMMGSPETEPGRYDREGPQHEVAIGQSFWMFETPCTQALWLAVMGENENPSRFVDVRRPVEQVSWNDAQEFIERLNSAVTGLALRLPTEAEWEYSCRACTTDATYSGKIEILGYNNAPSLDSIAWYGGNCGVGFDLDDGYDSSGWEEKQHDHSMAGTRTVARKHPNCWGLFDMLGNVLEWCQDWYGEYTADPQVNPQGPNEGHSRVFRGGAWRDLARHVRSAGRFNSGPGFRYYDVGFRCAQVQETKQVATSVT